MQFWWLEGAVLLITKRAFSSILDVLASASYPPPAINSQLQLEGKEQASAEPNRKRSGKLKMKALGWWLMLVGSLRLASVWFGFFDIWALRLAVFSNTISQSPLLFLCTPSFSINLLPYFQSTGSTT